MPSIFARGGRLYAKIQDIDGQWRQVSTGFRVDQRADAEKWVGDIDHQVRLARSGRLAPHPSFQYRPRTASYPSTRSGWVYAIVLDPSAIPFRIKVGFTTTN